MYDLGLHDLDQNLKAVCETHRNYEMAITKMLLRNGLKGIIKKSKEQELINQASIFLPADEKDLRMTQHID